jgi:hypothetical protein
MVSLAPVAAEVEGRDADTEREGGVVFARAKARALAEGRQSDASLFDPLILHSSASFLLAFEAVFL